jgi:O-antigen/teichoic acid export membrane protein
MQNLLKGRKFGYGLIAQVGVKLLAVSLGFFTTRWLISQLKVQEYETYNLIITYTNLILTIIYLGIPNLIQKFYTNEKDSAKLADYWATFGVVRLVSFFAALIIIVITYPLSQTRDLLNIVIIFTAQFILLTDLNYRSVCDAKQTTWQFSITDFAGKLLLISFLYSAIWFNLQFGFSNLIYFGLVSILAYSIALFLDFLWQGKHTPFGRVRWSIVKQNAVPIIYLGVSGLIVATFLNTDRLFLKYFGFSPETVNGYSNAYRLLEIATIVPSLITPTLASWIKGALDRQQTLWLGEKLKKVLPYHQTKWIISTEWSLYILILGVAITTSLLLLGDFALYLIDPTLKYPEAISSLKILSWTMIPLSLMNLYTHLVILFEGERDELVSMTLSGILQIGLYLWWIPLYGASGAAWSTVATFTFATVAKLILYILRLHKATNPYSGLI